MRRIADEPFAEPIVTHLRDGTRVLVRAVRSSDAVALQNGFAALSDTSRALRFLRPRTELTSGEVRDLTTPDHDWHEAIGALDITHDPARPAGIARYFRLEGDPSSAELAVTVVDAYQARGLGTLLLGLLLRTASEAGVERFLALVGRRNHAMIGLLRDLGGVWGSQGHEDREIVLPVRADPSGYPETTAGMSIRAAYALRAAAPRRA